jgi:hypothetical protein
MVPFLVLTRYFFTAFKGLFPRSAFSYILYTQVDGLVSDIEAYKIHMAFPVNGALARLRSLKAVAFSKVGSD